MSFAKEGLKMIKRFSIAILLLLALSACSVLAQPQSVPTSVPVAPTPTQVALIAPPTVPATPTGEPTPTPAPDLPAIWIEADSNRLVAIDAQTGEVLNQTFYEAVYRERIASSDGHWQYLWQAKSQPENHWQVSILAIGLTRSTSPQRITVAYSVPTTAQYPILVPHLALSKDNRLLFVSQSEALSDQRHTRVYVIDVVVSKVTRTVDVSTDDISLLIPSSDGWHLFAVQTMERQPPATQGALTAWYTRVALLNLESGAVERVMQVPNDMQAHSASVQAVLAPDGQRLFLLIDHFVGNGEPQLAFPTGGGTAYVPNGEEEIHFVALNPNTFEITRSQLSERGNRVDRFGGYDRLGWRFTPDGRFLVGYFWDPATKNAPYFQFLDTQTGSVAERVPLPYKQRDAAGPLYLLASPDNRLVYVIYSGADVFVFDMAKRAVVRSVSLKDKSSHSISPLNHFITGLSQWFMGTAYAKIYAMPGAVLSPDGQRLYFIDILSFDKEDGVWGVETATLKPIGHWFKDKEISGIMLSVDGKELYAASPSDHTIYVLDALTGQMLRALNLKQSGVKPLGFVTGQ